jgi:geranylgeranylglycerol-phosphate geranylgeranyltransferase
MRFVRAYVASMRLYYAFITGISGWIGVSFYHFCMPDQADTLRSALILVLLFLSWGINQIVNDYLGLREDRINAPHRPMVTGELPPQAALLTSGILLAGVAVLTAVLNPWALAPLLAGVLLNVLYEYAKAWSLLGNAIFGFSIAMCTAYGFLAAGPVPDPFLTSNRVCVFALVALMNGLMTYYTYFKDYRGDAAAGKRTFVVRYGLRVARVAGIGGAFLPALTFLAFHALDWLPLREVRSVPEFAFCAALTVLLQAWTAWLYYRHPTGARTYYNLATAIRACVAGQVALIAIFNGTLALYLMCASYVLVGFLFNLYQDARS